jgi:hypothetical protein
MFVGLWCLQLEDIAAIDVASIVEKNLELPVLKRRGARNWTIGNVVRDEFCLRRTGQQGDGVGQVTDTGNFLCLVPKRCASLQSKRNPMACRALTMQNLSRCVAASESLCATVL